MSKLLKEIAGTISPLYGGLTGQGLMGQLLSPNLAMALRQQEDGGDTPSPVPKRRYSKGGGVKKRGDGLAKKGKTKGRMK